MTVDQKGVIRFFNSGSPYRLRFKKKLKAFIPLIFKKEKKAFSSMNIILCSDYELLELNKEYLGRNYLTDTITFLFSQKSESIKGESYISLDRVKENALKENISTEEELIRVIFHGALHLCGYMDKRKEERLLMRKKEDYYIKEFKSCFT